MQTVYKVFLILFVVFIAVILYGLNWNLGFMHEENSALVFSIAAAVLGIMLVFVLNTWSKLSQKK